MKTLKMPQRGFTLIEIMIAVAITAVAVGMIYGMYASSQEAWDIKAEQADMQAQGRRALREMVDELRKTTRTSTQTPSPNLVIPSTPNNRQVDFYLPVDIDGDGTITDSNGDVEWDTSNKIRYQYVPGQKLLRRLEGGAQRTIALAVSDIRFTDQGIDPTLYRDELVIDLTLTKTTKRQRNLTMTFRGVVKLRN